MKNSLQVLTFGLVTLLATTVLAGQADYKGYKRGNTLISVHELKQLIDAHDPKLVILAAENSVE